MSRQRRCQGATLAEILVTMAVVMLGMGLLFRVLTSSIRGSARAQHITQALSRSQLIMENMRRMPGAVMTCLARQSSNNWAPCEASCMLTLGASSMTESCVFSTLATIQQDVDRSQQQYQVVYDDGDQTRSSWVTASGTSGHLFDIQITVGWNDNGTADPPDHRVTLRSAVFR